MNQAYFEWLALMCAKFDDMFFLSGTSVPALWRVSTGRQERLTAGTALSALLLQSMLGTTLHCTGQRWHGSGWVESLYAFIQALFSFAAILKMKVNTFFEQSQRNLNSIQFKTDINGQWGGFSAVKQLILCVFKIAHLVQTIQGGTLQVLSACLYVRVLLRTKCLCQQMGVGVYTEVFVHNTVFLSALVHILEQTALQRCGGSQLWLQFFLLMQFFFFFSDEIISLSKTFRLW